MPSSPTTMANLDPKPTGRTFQPHHRYSRFPGANATDTQAQTLASGPVNASSAAGFYANLLRNRRWWAAELAAEGMHELSLPSPASTNGSFLALQATHSIVRSMITRQNVWEPRYGGLPPCPASENTARAVR